MKISWIDKTILGHPVSTTVWENSQMGRKLIIQNIYSKEGDPDYKPIAVWLKIFLRGNLLIKYNIFENKYIQV